MFGPRFAALVFVALAAGGCAGAQPYVYTAAEFDRTRSDFGRPVTDIDAVTVCYGTWSASPAEVTTLAREECGKYGKVAHLVGQDRRTCPLVTPVAAHFACRRP
jgi:hypothetical protein